MVSRGKSSCLKKRGSLQRTREDRVAMVITLIIVFLSSFLSKEVVAEINRITKISPTYT